MKKVIKRDGRIVMFDSSKIENAVLKAFAAKDKELTDYAILKAKNIADYIEFETDKEILTVEEIQDMVENGLMSTKRKDVAKAYVLKREERSRERNKNATLTKIIKTKLEAKNIENQNANVDELSFGGRKGEAINAYMKQYALDYCMSEMAKNNHLNNEIYIHDLSHYAVGDHNCLTIPFDDLLANGFNTRQTDVRPAQSINTAFQLVAVIFQLQSLQQFGGVSAGHLDWTMIPYVRKSFSKHFKDGLKYCCCASDEYIDSVPNELSFNDSEANDVRNTKAYNYAMDMTVKETYQAVEGMFHNLNTLQSRSGNQLN